MRKKKKRLFYSDYDYIYILGNFIEKFMIYNFSKNFKVLTKFLTGIYFVHLTYSRFNEHVVPNICSPPITVSLNNE